MTSPEIGRAEIEVTADTSKFPGDVKRGVEESLRDADPTLKKAGQDWGDELSNGTKERIKFKFPEVIKEVKSALDKEHITEHVKVDTDVDHDSVRNAVRNIASDIENSGAGSEIGKFFGQGFLDGIGSAFNVSGKSPVLFFLVPLFGAIGALIAAAVEAVYGLGAALLTIPNLISAIALEAGVLYLIFHDIGGALSAALAAQSFTDVEKAIKGLDPYIQNFILEIVYIRDAFKAISGYLSIAFFKNLGNVLLDIFDYNRYTLFHGLLDLAGSLGTYFATIGKAFESPQFAKFLFDLFQEIDKFLASNGPVLQRFLTQVFEFLDSLMGATGDVGKVFNDFFTVFGNWLSETAKSKDFQDFLLKMPDILRDSGTLISALLDLLLAIISSTDKAGGDSLLTTLAQLVEILAAFFASDVGVRALEALIDTLLLLTAVFIDLVVIVGAVFAAFTYLADGIIWLGQKIWDFLKGVWKAITDSFSPHTFDNIISTIKGVFTDLINGAPGWGARLIQGFIDGVLSKIPGVKDAFHFIASTAASFLPHSPAKVGPFSGEGSPQARGEAAISDFAKGVMTASDQVATTMNNALSNVNFGPGAVIANFYGSQPTPDQANTLGTSVGNGISNQLLARNARLAVRTM